MTSLILILVLSYLIGSIPTSIIMGKLMKGIDVRQFGSGNAGGTNAFRVLGWKAGLFVSLFDIAKGVFATAVISQIRIDKLPFDNETLVMVLAGLCAILGHTFTIFAGFKGGKGVAAGAGMIIGLYPSAFLFCLLVFTLVLVSTGIVSISSMTAAVSLPFIMLISNRLSGGQIDAGLIIFSFIIPLFIIYTHRTNIKRLINGEERSFDKIRLFRRKKKNS